MDDIIIRIQNGDFDHSIGAIITAAKARKDMLSHVQAMATGARLKHGDRVILSGLSPKYINGTCAIVQAVNRTRVVVVPERPVGRFTGQCTVPLTCVTLAEDN
jgi:hypothetical protein